MRLNNIWKVLVTEMGSKGESPTTHTVTIGSQMFINI